MPLKGASITLYDQDGADSSTDVDSSDEVTLISHKPLPLLHKPLPLLPKPNQFEEHAQHQKSSYPTATRHPHLSQPKILAASSLKPTPSTYTPHPFSAYPRRTAEPDYDILPDDLLSQNTAFTALSPPPWHRNRQGGKMSYPLSKPNKFEKHPQYQVPSYPTHQRPPLSKLRTHQVCPHLSQPKLLTESSFKPTPSTYTPHPSQSSSPSGSPSLPSAYLASLAELHYILPDGLSSQNTALTALSPPPRHRARQGGKVLYEPMDHTLCPIHHSTQPCWSCDKARNRDTNEKLRFPF